MPTPEIGPVGRQLGSNVHRLRRVHELSLRELSERLGQLGRPILASGLLKIENADRRVDVDDLVALASALHVSTGRLLTEKPETAWTAHQQERHREAIAAAATAIMDAADKEEIHPQVILDYLAEALEGYPVSGEEGAIVPEGDDGQR